jgi:hypothetical protein
MKNIISQNEIEMVINYIEDTFNLANENFQDEYGYKHLPLCVIDTVFSIGANYASTRNTVQRFSNFTGINEDSREYSINQLLELYAKFGIHRMAGEIFHNRQRTSTTNGLLKAEAVLYFALEIFRNGANKFNDIHLILGNKQFEEGITNIPGQKSGISLRYFYMLAGSEDFIKPDRMIIRFLHDATGKIYSVEGSEKLLLGACKEITKSFPALTPRKLDNLIWQHQRGK